MEALKGGHWTGKKNEEGKADEANIENEEKKKDGRIFATAAGTVGNEKLLVYRMAEWALFAVKLL